MITNLGLTVVESNDSTDVAESYVEVPPLDFVSFRASLVGIAGDVAVVGTTQEPVLRMLMLIFLSMHLESLLCVVHSTAPAVVLSLLITKSKSVFAPCWSAF